MISLTKLVGDPKLRNRERREIKSAPIRRFAHFESKICHVRALVERVLNATKNNYFCAAAWSCERVVRYLQFALVCLVGKKRPAILRRSRFSKRQPLFAPLNVAADLRLHGDSVFDFVHAIDLAYPTSRIGNHRECGGRSDVPQCDGQLHRTAVGGRFDRADCSGHLLDGNPRSLCVACKLSLILSGLRLLSSFFQLGKGSLGLLTNFIELQGDRARLRSRLNKLSLEYLRRVLGFEPSCKRKQCQRERAVYGPPLGCEKPLWIGWAVRWARRQVRAVMPWAAQRANGQRASCHNVLSLPRRTVIVEGAR